MITAIFSVDPHGPAGMDNLAAYLKALVRAGKISDWRGLHAVADTAGARYVVQFVTQRDADCAIKRWKPFRKGLSGADNPEHAVEAAL